MRPLISIIIPVYNVEKYLKACLDSVVNQTLKSIEIIVVDDGSTDNSKDIIRDFELKDSRVKAIYQKNKGVSQARNAGLKIANGEYIGFVDADDYIDLEMYESMYSKAKQFDSDIVVCNVKDIMENKEKISLEFQEGLISMENIKPKNFLKDKYFKLGSAVWHKIFKKSLIVENNIKFINYNEVSSEDTIFNLQAMLKSKNIYCIDKPFYNYIIRENSLTKSKIAKENMIYRCKNTVDIIQKYCEENNIDIDKYIYYLTYFEFINSLSYVHPKNLNNLSLGIKEYSKSEFYNKSLKNIIFSNTLDIYFINHKNGYSTMYKIFDKMFSLLCFVNLNRVASSVHLLRIKRTEMIQNKASS